MFNFWSHKESYQSEEAREGGGEPEKLKFTVEYLLNSSAGKSMYLINGPSAIDLRMLSK
jgi:hypothetical protein